MHINALQQICSTEKDKERIKLMADSVNHQFVELSEKVHARYVKTCLNSITGKRLDPNQLDRQIDFFLSTPESSFNFMTKTSNGFSYEDEVLEFYSEAEVKYFLRINKYLVSEGLVKIFEGEIEEGENLNFLDDSEITTMALLQNLKAAQKRINDLTSITTLNRVLAAMEEHGRKESFKTLVKQRIEDLKNQ